jgi:hypothetical protein
VREVSANSGEIRVGYLPQRRADPESGTSLYIKVLIRRRSTANINCTRRYGSCPVIMPRGDTCSNYATLRHSHKHFTFTAISWPSQSYLSPKYKLCTLSDNYRSSPPATTPPRRMGCINTRKQRPMGRCHNTVLTSCGWRSLASGIEMRDRSKVPAPRTPEKQF